MKIALPFSFLLGAIVAVALADSGVETTSNSIRLAKSQMDMVTAAGTNKSMAAVVIKITGPHSEALAHVMVGRDGKIRRNVHKANRITQTSTIVHRHRRHVSSRINQTTTITQRHKRGSIHHNITQVANVTQKVSQQ